MNNKGLLACLAIILAAGATVVGRTTAQAAGVSLPAPASLPPRLDASKLALARRTASPTPFAAPTLDGSSSPQPARLTAAEWQKLRGSIAVLTKRPLAAMAASLTDSADLSAPGNRITIMPSSLPPGTSMLIDGPTLVQLRPSTSLVHGQAGARIKLTFPATSGAVYLISCSDLGEVDYSMEVATPSDWVFFDGHAEPQADGSTHMVWVAPANLIDSEVQVRLKPIDLPAPLGNTFRRIFSSCDILRVS